MSTQEELGQTLPETIQGVETAMCVGSQAVDGVIISQNKIAASLQAGPVRNIISPRVANPDLITF